MTDVLDRVRRRALAALRPPPRMALSAWAETNFRLPEGGAAMPGPLRLWPPQRGIADSISDPEAERVTVIKAARVGFSTLLNCAIGNFISNDPSPIILLLPTEADCRDVVVSDLEPAFEASPVLRGVLSVDDGDEKRNTLMHRRFPGGSLKVIAAKAPRNLRRHTARVLIVDEADGMETGAEGSPILLAERRTLTFADRKIIVGSTPVDEDTSHVVDLYNKSDRRIFEVPCIHCGAFFEIVWSCIEWEEGRPETAACRCPHCDGLISERHKLAMLDAGRWRAMAPEVKGHHGYCLSALASPLANASWGRLAAEFLAAKDRPDQLRVFVNTVLGEPWREAGEEIDEDGLASRVEPIGLDRIPEEVIAITAGVDVQVDRIEAAIVAWTEAGDMIVLGHIILWGDPQSDSLWAEVDELLSTRWSHPLGGKITIDAAAVDAGDGHVMDAVLAFCGPRAHRRVLAVKGAAGDRPAVVPSQTRRGKLWIIGVDSLKSQLYARLRGGRSVRFSESLPAEWFAQLASERRVVRYSRGRPTARWERIPGRRAEALDCVVYAMAARQVVTINPETRLALLRGKPQQPSAPRKFQSSFVNGDAR